MKNKLIIGSILTIITFLITLSFVRVTAYSGELDPKNYITLPSEIRVQNRKGTGKIELSTSASGYSVSYQKIDITQSKLQAIESKQKELSNCIETNTNTLKEKEKNVSSSKEAYETLKNSGTATEEEITEAYNKYTTAYQDYEQFYNTANSKITNLQSELIALIPDYTNSWKATDSSNNVNLDFTDYSGTIHFVLWVKITNGTNTYYDMEVYSSVIREEQGETSGEWTDFTNAKIELKKDGISKASIQISNVTPNSESEYYLFITSNSNKPNVTSSSDERIFLTYDANNKVFNTNDTEKVAKYVELNQDLYVTIVEKRNSQSENIVVYGKKLVRYSEPKYNDAFNLTFISSDSTQLVTCFTHAASNNRKFQIKVGKITNMSILNKIKNKDSSGFADLISFAKTSDGIYNNLVNAELNNSHAISYIAGADNKNSIINLKGLQNDAYYFLYVKTDDENGKYISNEAVTLAQARVDSDLWNLFFYGSSDFKWVNLDDSGKDPTTADGMLPQTGLNVLICVSLGIALVGVGTFSYIQYRKNNY